MMENMLQGMFKSLPSGLCRLTMNGNLAIKTTNGYKSYNVKNKRLTNCNNFAFDIGQDMFFIIPTNKVNVGDVIIANGMPKCVISVDVDEIKAINYETSTIEIIVPERHIMMGNTYFYGKIVSMFGDASFCKSKKGTNNMMKYMMLSSMMNGGGVNNPLGIGSGEGNNFFAGLMKYKMMENMLDGDMFSMFGDVFDSEDEANDVADKEEM